MAMKSKREVSEGAKAPRGGQGKEFDGGGFAEGNHGRGSTPYKKSHSAAPGSLKQHEATSGRGAAGIFGSNEQNKGHATDFEHPASHAAFEDLGRG